MGHIISIVNNKGGVHKTTVTVNLADSLSKKGKTVLVVDMDAQANATSRIIKDRGAQTIYEIINPNESNVNIFDAIKESTIKRVDLLPNVTETANLEPELISNAPESFKILRNRLRKHVINSYDYVIIDNPPNMGTFILISLYASDFVIVPIKAGSTDSVKGLAKATEIITQLKESGENPDLKFLRLLISGLDKRTGIGPAVTNQIRNNFNKNEVFNTEIPVNTAFEKAEYYNQTVFQHDPSSRGAKAYRTLAKEVIKILEG